MSIDSALGALQSITTTISIADNTIKRVAADFGGGGLGGDSGTGWAAQLRPASWRGVPFGVLGGGIKFGRRTAVHEYPYRDTVWVEDLGRAVRRITMTGFLVGDDVIAQRDRMIAAAETAGSGELIHPTLGQLTASAVECVAEEKWEQGRVFQLSFTFIESGKRVFPSVQVSTGSAVLKACAQADAASKGDFLASTSAALKQGAAVVAKVASTAATWGRQAQRLANDATNLYNMVGTLKGGFGRYAKGNGIAGIAVAAGAVSTAANSIPKLIALGSAARTAVSSAVEKLTSTASGLGS
ncbi:hypothetical protein JAB8_38220 [Janthinobacterium sp. HH106]|uniref:DNA circularization N-terminal domain-containing protein n=1 Tax=Janthinobacterium sp. HH106 TaxID=1537278 RepID=UPI000874499B|nr:DNA circularization N-terminal domain-containing protein [Janthinobacterium sp. HH106]OEZ85640.1 hypothetical protein JAB8_38220 [Janthinobacterium sp. HH106]